MFVSNEKRLFFYKSKQSIQEKVTSKKVSIKKVVKKKITPIKTKKIKTDPNSPFAVLQKLL